MKNVGAYKAKPPRVYGSTKISHNIRVKMGLGCQEYVLMECIVSLLAKRKPVTDVIVYQETGLVPEEAGMTLEMLVKKGYIYPEATADGAPNVSPMWRSHFTSAEGEFDEFWTKDGKVCWTGSKPKAKELYVNVRKEHEKEFVMSQRDAYFEFLNITAKGGFNRPKMMATVFLGAQERFMEDWPAYIKTEQERQEREASYPDPLEDTVPSTTTSKDRQKKYED